MEMCKKLPIHLNVETRPQYSYRRIMSIISLTFFMSFTLWLYIQYVTKSVAHERRNYHGVGGDLGEERRILKAQLKSLLKCQDKPLITETLQPGNYWLLKNLIRGRRSIDMDCSESITYTTIGDYRFMGHLGRLVKRWLGPISFALFAPGYDFNDTMEAIQYARNCLPESQLIRDYVSFHIYFPNEHVPYEQVPHSEQEALKWPYDCLTENVPYDNVDPRYMYKTSANLSFPINVGRNIARKAANTHFILASDIELYPSLDFIQQFLQITAKNVSLVRSGNKPRVFPLPVFEVLSNATLPDTKAQLVTMLQKKEAVPFHEKLCKKCHMIPDYDRWLKAKFDHKLEVISVAKRQAKYVYWEPFYVSDNKEPDFDARLTWEGQSDKRIQNYAMCLLDYEYHILHPGFLVHSPGIKTTESNPERLRYLKPMAKFIADEIVPGYEKLYGKNKMCRV